MEKLAVALWNYKGGVGKSTISLILAETAAQKGLNVVVVDLDGQKNLSSAMGFVMRNNYFANITLKDCIAPGDENIEADMFVIDCRPETTVVVENAISFADIILVPVIGDFFSAANVGYVWEFIKELDKYPAQASLVKNCFENTVTTREIDNVLQQQGLSVAGRIPRNANLLRNIASGRPWWVGMDSRQQAPFLDLYSRVWGAYTNMLKGNFMNPWH